MTPAAPQAAITTSLSAADFVPLIGAANVVSDQDTLAARAADWTGWSAGTPSLLLKPVDTEGVAQCLALCSERGQPVAVQGGRTGLSGAASCRDGEIALSLEKLAGVEAVDPVGSTMTVKAGTTLEAAQQAALEHGLELGIDLGARGSCMIGGVIGTNAGGIRVIGTGMTRAHVLGIEAVLADGTVLTDMNAMVKNNSGYDLKQLFIGSEGTLGVVTRAVLKLSPHRPAVATALVALPCPDDITTALAAARQSLGASLSAFEAMWADFLTAITTRGGFERAMDPVPAMSVIIETRGNDDDEERTRLETFLQQGLEAGWVTDAILANSVDQTRRLWMPRDEGPATYLQIFGGIVPFDVSVPIGLIVETAESVNREVGARWPEATRLTYGHIGDSNLHFVVAFDDKPDAATTKAVNDVVYGAVGRVGGAVSAEHGVGQLKKAYLPLSRSDAAIDLMRRLKAALDPAGILNPGRVV